MGCNPENQSECWYSSKDGFEQFSIVLKLKGKNKMKLDSISWANISVGKVGIYFIPISFLKKLKEKAVRQDIGLSRLYDTSLNNVEKQI